MTIDKLIKLYAYCYIAYKNIGYLKHQGLDEQHINGIAEEIVKLQEKEINRYRIVDKSTLTQMTIEEYYSNFNFGLYETDINCNECNYESCVSCISDAISDLYTDDDEFREEFDKRYKIIKKI